jgi:hypothetical protein
MRLARSRVNVRMGNRPQDILSCSNKSRPTSYRERTRPCPPPYALEGDDRVGDIGTGGGITAPTRCAAAGS